MMIYFIFKSTKRIKVKVLLVLEYCIPLLIAVLLTLRERSKFASMPSYEINLNLTEYFPVLVRQIYASFPLSYFSSNPGDIFTHDTRKIINEISIADSITVILFLLIVIMLLSKTADFPFRSPKPKGLKSFKKIESRKHANTRLTEQLVVNRIKDSARRKVLVFGSMLLILPNMLIALSPTYQYLIYWGIAHLPVYISYFGSFLVLSVLVDKLMTVSRKNLRHSIAIFLIALISIGYAINLQNNRLVVETQNQTYWYKRNFIESSQSATNFLANLKSDSLLLYSVEDNLSLDVQPFLYSLIGINVENIDTRRLLPWYKQFQEGRSAEELKSENPDYWTRFGSSESDLFSKYKNVYIIKYWSDSYSQGYVTTAEISDLVLAIDDGATFVKTIGANILVLKSEKEALKFEYRTFLCPKLISTCLDRSNYLKTSRAGNFSEYGEFKQYLVTTEAAINQMSAWLDFKSIRIEGMDSHNLEP